MNISTIIVLIIILMAFVLAVRSIIKNGDTCSCGCKCCGSCKACNKNPQWLA